MLTERLMPPGVKPPAAQTPEDREIIRAHKAGLMVLFDRLDAHDMLLYAVLRAKGLQKRNLGVGATQIANDLDQDFVQHIIQAVDEATDGPEGRGRAPTIQ